MTHQHTIILIKWPTNIKVNIHRFYAITLTTYNIYTYLLGINDYKFMHVLMYTPILVTSDWFTNSTQRSGNVYLWDYSVTRLWRVYIRLYISIDSCHSPLPCRVSPAEWWLAWHATAPSLVVPSATAPLPSTRHAPASDPSARPTWPTCSSLETDDRRLNSSCNGREGPRCTKPHHRTKSRSYNAVFKCEAKQWSYDVYILFVCFCIVFKN